MQNSDCIDSIPLKRQGIAHKNSPNNIKCDRTLKVIHWGIRLHWFHLKSQRFCLKQYTPHHNVCSSQLNMKCVKRCLRRRDTEPCSGYVTQHRDDKTSLPLLLEAWPFHHTGWQAGSVESQGGSREMENQTTNFTSQSSFTSNNKSFWTVWGGGFLGERGSCGSAMRKGLSAVLGARSSTGGGGFDRK